MTIRGIEHIGITVPDHDAACAFFKAAFGAEPLFSQTATNGGPFTAAEMGPMNRLRPGTRALRISVLRLQDGPNVEIFEIDRPSGNPESNVADYGISHFSVMVTDLDAAIDRFVAAGGTTLSDPYDLDAPEDGPGNRGVFGRAPWGLLIEMESLPAPMTYLPGTDAVRWRPGE